MSEDFLASIEDHTLSKEKLYTETELINHLNCAQNPAALREALSLFTRSGLVVPHPDRAYQVRSFKTNEVEDLLKVKFYTLNLFLESLIKRNLSEEKIQRLQSLVENLERSSEEKQFLYWEQRVCATYALYSTSLTGGSVIGSFCDNLRIYHAFSPLNVEAKKSIAKFHKQLLEKINLKDLSGAKQSLYEMTNFWLTQLE